MFLSIPPGVKFEAKSFTAMVDPDQSDVFVRTTESQGYFPNGVLEVKQICVRDSGSSRIVEWVVLVSALARKQVFGQPLSVVKAWSDHAVRGIHLGDSIYGEVRQLAFPF